MPACSYPSPTHRFFPSERSFTWGWNCSGSSISAPALWPWRCLRTFSYFLPISWPSSWKVHPGSFPRNCFPWRGPNFWSHFQASFLFFLLFVRARTSRFREWAFWNSLICVIGQALPTLRIWLSEWLPSAIHFLPEEHSCAKVKLPLPLKTNESFSIFSFTRNTRCVWAEIAPSAWAFLLFPAPCCIRSTSVWTFIRKMTLLRLVIHCELPLHLIDIHPLVYNFTSKPICTSSLVTHGPKSHSYSRLQMLTISSSSFASITSNFLMLRASCELTISMQPNSSFLPPTQFFRFGTFIPSSLSNYSKSKAQYSD